MQVYRIADSRYITDLSGRGAALHGGRWNSKDIYMVYTAESPALALLEAVVHIGKVPESGFCMITIELPDENIGNFSASKLPADWYKNPPPDHLKTIGDQFIKSGKLSAIKVPSVIMPEEHNVLLNPAHKDFIKVKIITNRMLTIDERLLYATGKTNS